MSRKFAGLLVAVVLCALTASCFDIEQSLILEKDMSGKAGFRMTINFEPMAMIMMQMQRSMEGKKGPATAAEIAKAKADFLAQSKSKEEKTDPAAERKEIEKSLPPGVTLVDQSIKDEGMKMTTNVVFHFTDPSKLDLIALPQKKGAQPTDKNAIDKPFGGLEIKDEGSTFIVRTPPANPLKSVDEGTAEAGGGGADNKEMEAMVKDALKTLRVAFKIQAPFKVVESNATRRDGNTLYWEYNADTLEKMQKSGELDKMGVYVKYKK